MGKRSNKNHSLQALNQLSVLVVIRSNVIIEACP
jgi:hypothetical protein